MKITKQSFEVPLDSLRIYCAISPRWCIFCTKLHRLKRVRSKYLAILQYDIFYCQNQGPHPMKRCFGLFFFFGRGGGLFFFIFIFQVIVLCITHFSKTINILLYSIVSQPNNFIKIANTFLSSGYFRWFMQNVKENQWDKSELVKDPYTTELLGGELF